MKIKHLLFGCICFWMMDQSNANAQKAPPCDAFEQILLDAEQDYKARNYSSALDKLTLARICDPSKAAQLDSRIRAIFSSIDALRQEAQKSEAEANRLAQIRAEDAKLLEEAYHRAIYYRDEIALQKDTALAALSKARKLLSYLDFDTLNVAWAYNSRKGFGLINTEGDTVIGFGFDAVQPFDRHGLALASKLGRYYVVDKKGQFLDTLNAVYPTNYGGFRINENGKFSLADSLYRPFENWPRFDSLGNFLPNGFARAKVGFGWQLVKPARSIEDTPEIRPFFFSNLILYPDSFIVAWTPNVFDSDNSKSRIGLYSVNAESSKYDCRFCDLFFSRSGECNLDNYILVMSTADEVKKINTPSRYPLGMINRDGKEIIPAIYDEIIPIHSEELPFCDAQSFLAITPKDVFIINTNGKIKFTIGRKYLEDISEDHRSYFESVGYNSSRRNEIEENDIQLYSMEDELIYINRKEHAWLLQNPMGGKVKPVNIDIIGAAESGKWSEKYRQTIVMNEKGKVIGKSSYNTAIVSDGVPIFFTDFSDGSLVFANGKKIQSALLKKIISNVSSISPWVFYKNFAIGKYGITDEKFNKLTDAVFDTLYTLDNSHFGYALGGKYGIISKQDVKTNNVYNLNPLYDEPLFFGERAIAKFIREGTYGLIDLDGKETVLNSVVDSFEILTDDLLMVRLNLKYGAVNKFGIAVLPPLYSSLIYDREAELLIVSSEGRRGIVNPEGRLILPVEFDNIRFFSDGVAWVQQYGKWGLVDAKGNRLIAPKFDDVNDFEHGSAMAKFNNEWLRINKKGELIVIPED